MSQTTNHLILVLTWITIQIRIFTTLGYGQFYELWQISGLGRSLHFLIAFVL